MFEFFDYQVNNGVALVTMNRPPANAMSRQVYESLDTLLDHVESSDAHEKSARLVETADYKEGVQAFLEKRPPVYKR